VKRSAALADGAGDVSCDMNAAIGLQTTTVTAAMIDFQTSTPENFGSLTRASSVCSTKFARERRSDMSAGAVTRVMCCMPPAVTDLPCGA